MMKKRSLIDNDDLLDRLFGLDTAQKAPESLNHVLIAIEENTWLNTSQCIEPNCNRPSLRITNNQKDRRTTKCYQHFELSYDLKKPLRNSTTECMRVSLNTWDKIEPYIPSMDRLKEQLSEHMFLQLTNYIRDLPNDQ